MGGTGVLIDVPFSSAAARIAVMTTDESVMLAAQENLASDFHITLLDAGEGVLALQSEVPLEAVILDLDTPEGSAEPMLELVSQLRAKDEHLVLIGLIQSLTKVSRRKFLAALPAHLAPGGEQANWPAPVAGASLRDARVFCASYFADFL